MATFNGIDLGPFAKVRVAVARVDLQLTRYPGVDGLAMLRMGSRGMVTEATGACVGVDLASLAATEVTFMEMQSSAVLGTLVDTLGRTWPDAVLVAFAPGDETYYVPGYGWGREYRMEFLHLS